MSSLVLWGCTADHTGPEVVAGFEATIVSIDVGIGHFCVLTESGNVLCAGDDALGQLGDGAPSCRGDSTCLGIPVAVAGEQTFAFLSVGTNMACGVNQVGLVSCWGNDITKGLGSDGVDRCDAEAVIDSGRRCNLEPASVEMPVAITSISVGGTQTLYSGFGGGPVCAIGVDSLAYCWGRGALGFSAAPVPVEGAHKFTSLDVGETGDGRVSAFVCGVALEEGGNSSVYCWGNNPAGQLGSGDKSARNVPNRVAVSRSLSLRKVSSGESHACALDASGHAFCWGANGAGQLGDSTKVETLRPLPIRSDETWVEISAGVNHTCALNTDGQAFCWGRNWSGQLGSGGPGEGAPIPIPVAGSLPFESIRAGPNYTCALRTDGTVYCWGFGRGGQFGTGERHEFLQHPTRVFFEEPTVPTNR